MVANIMYAVLFSTLYTSQSRIEGNKKLHFSNVVVVVVAAVLFSSFL